MRSTATITLTALALTLATSTLSYVINPSHAPSLNDTTALLPRADAIADCTVARTEVSSPIFNGWYNIHDARARCSAITAADCAAAAICKKDASGNLGLGFKDWKDCGSNEVMVMCACTGKKGGECEGKATDYAASAVEKSKKGGKQ